MMATSKKPRPSVVAFGKDMEVKLKANDWKGGWNPENCSTHTLLAKLQEEVQELIEAAANHEFGGPEEGSAVAVVHEAADVANVAMMLAERAKGLPNGPRGQGEG